MVVHTCVRCEKEFNKKSNYLQHLSKKNQCKLKAEINRNQSNINLNNENSAFSDLSDEFNKYICNHCKKSYVNKYVLNKHILSCKVKLNNDLVNKIALLEKEMEILKTKTNKKGKKALQNVTIINNNINNGNITTNNQINIANFGKIDNSKIGDKIFFHSLTNYSGIKPLLEFVKYVHKNSKFKEYQNVEITDLGRNLGQIIENNKWVPEDANEITDKVVDETYNYYEVKFDALEDEIDGKPQQDKNKIKRNKRFICCMRGSEMFEMNDDGDYVDDDGVKVSQNDFKNGKKFEDKLKKQIKLILKT